MASFDYTSRDYLSIRQDLLDRASALIPEWTSRNRSDFGVLLVDLWSYMGDILHYYVDRAAAESYLNTATQKSSILAIANLLDYKPTSQTSAVGSVTIQLVGSGIVNIPKGTGFVAAATENSPIVYFTSTASASLGPSATTVTVPVAEGKLVVDEEPINTITQIAGLSNGGSSQRFNLRYTGVVASSVEVTVSEGPVVGGVAQPVSYSYTTDLSIVSSSSRSFTLETSADGVTQVIFGNGINGKVPNNGATVRVSYRRGQGYLGNIIENRILNYDAGSLIANTTITSSSATSGGADSESIESMRANIPMMFRTQDRAVSVQDFKDLALRAPQVIKATCDSASAPNMLLYVTPYQTDYLNTSATSVTIPSIIRDGVVSYFAPRIMVGASVSVSPTVALSPIDITVTVNVQNEYVAEWVKNAVQEVIDDFFTFENVSFGQVLSLGSVYRAIHNVEGVDYANISLFRRNGLTAQSVYTTVSAVNDFALMRKGAVSIATSGGVTGVLTN